MKTIYCLIFCSILLSSITVAVGISGDLDPEGVFTPGGKYDFYFTGIANPGSVPINHEILVKEDLAEYVTLEKQFFPGLIKAEHIDIRGSINFPEYLKPPKRYLKVCLIESCSGGTMCGRASACVRITIYVPHEGIYPEASLRADNVNIGEPVSFHAVISNSGKETIKSCSGEVTVFNLNRESVGKAKLSPAENIASYKSGGLSGDFDTTGLKPGNYSATANIDCDGVKTSANTTFRIGNLEVKIIDFTRELRQGGIQKFQTEVESYWNDPLNIDASIRIHDDSKNIPGDTPTKRLEPWKTLKIDTFIDTSSLELKEYDVDITVRYGDGSSTKKGKVLIVAGAEEEPEAEKAPAEEEPEKETGISTTTLTIILVVVVILLTAVNVFLAVYRKKKE